MVLVYISYNISRIENKQQLLLKLDHICKVYKKIKTIILELELMVSSNFNRWNTL